MNSTTTTMSPTLGVPATSLPLSDPPTAALPPLPIAKTRKSLPGPSVNASALSPRIPSAPQTPSKLRTPSKATIPLPTPKAQAQAHAASTPAVPTLKTLANKSSAGVTAEKSLRKSVSIASFPQPPRKSSRIGRPSLPATIATSNLPSSSQKKPGSADSLPVTPVMPAVTKIKKLKKSSSSATLNTSYSNGPSLLNGSGDSVPISAESSQSLLNSGSRCSSAQGSNSTGTNFEDIETAPRRNRESHKDGDETSSRRSTLKEGKGNVVVSVRVRPNDGSDAKSDGEWMVDGRRNLISFNGKEGGDYYYDNVFSPHDSNAKLYEVSAKRLVRRVMEGYHGTVFAYGMTGTGKTFSMQGIASQPGIIPQAVTDIFSYIRETPHREFLLRASYLEIYNEEIRDLLIGTQAGVQPEKIQLREDRKRGVYATPIKEEIVQSPMQLLRVISRGDRNRHVGTTQYNLHSSRSHAIVKITVESRERAMAEGSDDKRSAIGAGGVRVSSLSMIDLAGSERAADSKERRTEGAHINKSLLTLGTVIARLSGDKDKNGNPTDKDGKHLPYRDSKLTRLLQPALSGTSLISILCTIQIGSSGSVATANSHTGETLNTLKFAARAKNNIVSHAKKADEAQANSADPGSIALLDHYRKEIANLRNQLNTSVELQSQAEEILATKVQEEQEEKEMDDRHKDHMLEMQLARTALKERIEHLNRLIITSQSQGVNMDRSMSAMSLHPALSNAHISLTLTGTRSLRSSASGSTIQLHRTQSGASQTTISSHLAALRSQSTASEMPPSLGYDAADMDEIEEGMASLEAQNASLHRDLAAKQKTIDTLQKRLQTARRTSNPRASVGVSLNMLQEKDQEISDLRSRLDDKDRIIAELKAQNASMQHHDTESSTTTPVSPSVHNHHTSDSFGSSSAATSNSMSFSPIEIPRKKSSYDLTPANTLSPQLPGLQPSPVPPKELPPVPSRQSDESGTKSNTQSRSTRDRVGALRDTASSNPQRRSIDEMSRMLDEMIQEKVERGELITDGRRTGTPMRKMHSATHSKENSFSNRHGASDTGNNVTFIPERKESLDAVPSVGALMAGLRSRTDSLERERDGGKMGVKDRERHVGLGLEIEG